MSVFPFNTFFLVVVAAAIAAGILGFGSVKGGGFLKKQGVAWVITGVMVLCAIGIGYAKAPVNNPAPKPDVPNAPASGQSYVWDNAHVLSDQEVRVLDQRNDRLWDRYQVTIGAVTCNYGGDDLYDYVLQCAEDMGLGGYDMIVVLDIQGDSYWLLQGDDIRRDFTDNDCADYAYEYMEYEFDHGFYGEALLSLTEGLEVWYGSYFE